MPAHKTWSVKGERLRQTYRLRASAETKDSKTEKKLVGMLDGNKCFL